MRILSVLLGVTAVVVAATTERRINGVPRRAAKKWRRPDKLHRKLHYSREFMMLERDPQRSKHSITVPRKLTAAVASNSGNTPAPLPAQESKTLESLYQNLNGPEWHFKDGWMSTSNPCGSGGFVSDAWYGVECKTFDVGHSGNFSSHVTGLALPQNHLVGTLPRLDGLQHLLNVDFSSLGSSVSQDFDNSVGGTLDALCGLDNLSTVQLTGNNLTGSIPDCIQRLANVKMLYLANNGIVGTMPDEICFLRSLEQVVLSKNALTGTVPSCLGTLSQIIGLELESNQFHGPIPESLCHASALESLYLHQNALTGTIPRCLGSLGHLEWLDLSTNPFYGSIPEELCQLSALKELALAENALTGTVPSCLGNLRLLIELGLYINQFHGPIPKELCHASALEILDLSENALTGTLPSCLGNLSHLAELDVDTNQIHGPITNELCYASALKLLILVANALTGTIPSCLENLSQLQGLELSTNQFRGPIPESLCHASTLKYLLLPENALTGTIPSCLGSLSELTELDLSMNAFDGSIPEELCQASLLELLILNGNFLTGSLPSYLTKSFTMLQVMLLHDNDLAGELPCEWSLPSLVSIILSNNPKISGSLPPSLFLQQDASNASVSTRISNDMLRAVVIEGTSIGGTLPAALCATPQLNTIALSGNKLTGSLPNCISSLQNLYTLRVSNNYLTGTLPETINNMTSLTVLDLSTNEIQGQVPAGLGDISPNLNTVHLQFNRLSCDLPASVLDWQASSANVSFSLLGGNLFGCGKDTFLGIFALSIQGAVGLRNANKQAFDAYSCGSADYVLPAMTVAILAVPVVVGVIVMAFRGRLALQWRFALEWAVNPSMLINELDHADRRLRAPAFEVVIAATVSGIVALVLSLVVTKSAFECEYMAAPTFANKGESNALILSIGIGASVCAGLVFGLVPWWYHLVMKLSSSTLDCGGIVVEKNKLLYSLDEDAEAWDYDAERIAEARPQILQAASSIVVIFRVLKVVPLFLALAILAIGPNVGYVLIFLSQLTQQQKVASGMAVTLAKTAIGVLVVPKVARIAVDLLVRHGAFPFVRFRLRIAIATVLSAVSMIMLPVMTVLVTDPRCFYYRLKPQPAVNTGVPISACSLSDKATGTCLEYSTETAMSTFTPSFAYDGEVCISAVLAVYGPVFLGVVLFAATLPAGVETLIVPWLAPWCYRNSKTSTVARTGLIFLCAVAWNVWPVLANAGVLPHNFSFGADKLDHLAQRVVERAFVQVIVTLLVALTFGIAVPIVGGASAVAALVQLLHHRHVLGQIVGLGRLEQPAVVPNLMGCTDIPTSCAVVVVATVVMVWVCGTVGYLEPVVIGCALLIGLIMALAACGVVAWHRSKAPSQHRDRAQSTTSSKTSRGMLIESLLANDGNIE